MLSATEGGYFLQQPDESCYSRNGQLPGWIVRSLTSYLEPYEKKIQGNRAQKRGYLGWELLFFFAGRSRVARLYCYKPALKDIQTRGKDTNKQRKRNVVFYSGGLFGAG